MSNYDHFQQQALAGELDPSVPPLERIRILNEICMMLLEHAQLPYELEQQFLVHITIATFGSADGLAEHQECMEWIRLAGARASLNMLIKSVNYNSDNDNTNDNTNDNADNPFDFDAIKEL